MAAYVSMAFHERVTMTPLLPTARGTLVRELVRPLVDLVPQPTALLGQWAALPYSVLSTARPAWQPPAVSMLALGPHMLGACHIRLGGGIDVC